MRKIYYFLLGHGIKTKDLFYAQYDKNGLFQAYDTCVRYAFAREFLTNGGKHGFWYKLYTKMQNKRGTMERNNTQRFIDLINSYVKNGYNGLKIVLFKHGKVLSNGSHRLALNLLFNYKYIYFKRNDTDKDTRNYGINWFKNNGFSKKEISEICKIKNEIFQKYHLENKMD